MTKQTITKDEYWQIYGLLTLAHNLERQIESIESSMAEILDVEDMSGGGYYGQVSDSVYMKDVTAKMLLKMMKVKVK